MCGSIVDGMKRWREEEQDNTILEHPVKLQGGWDPISDRMGNRFASTQLKITSNYYYLFCSVAVAD